MEVEVAEEVPEGQLEAARIRAPVIGKLAEAPENTLIGATGLTVGRCGCADGDRTACG